MVCGPFSSLMQRRNDGGYKFSEVIKERIESVLTLLEREGHEVLSAHVADHYGECPWVENFVQRDLQWTASSDVQIVLLPAGPEGASIRSDGTMIELGFATALGKPVIILADDLANPANSYFVHSFAKRNVAACISWGDGFETALLECLAETIQDTRPSNPRHREQRTDVDQVMADLRHERSSHKVVVNGMLLTVLPGVFSPWLSHAPDTLISKWTLPPEADVLDLGCGCGVLGLAALKQGVARLVALDSSPKAIQNTTLNLSNLGFSDRGEARVSDGYAALNPGETFDVILFAAPYWDRVAADDLERSCFDENYSFFQTAIGEAHGWLKTNGTMYVIFSDQGDVIRTMRIISESALHIVKMHLFRPTQPGGHIRIVWELSARSNTERPGIPSSPTVLAQ